MITAMVGGADILIAINSDRIAGMLHASMTTSNFFSSDSFALTFAVGPSPLGDLAFWSTITPAYVEISAIVPPGSSTQSLITGMVDTIFIDPVQGTATIEGRDLSASLIDSYRQQDFVNQTASEVVSALAQYHGLGATVAPTSGCVGRYYGDGYTRLSLGRFSRLRSDWDLAVQLARENDFNIFVQGKTLFFLPSTNSFDEPVHISTWNVQRVRVERSLAITPAISARVQSWNSQTMTSYDSNPLNGSASGTQPSSTLQNQPFLFSSSNFTSQQVTDSATRYAAELGHLATVLHLDMPWDFSLSPRTTILLDSTNSVLDRTYRIDSIERHYNSRSGSSQSIRAVGI